VAMAVVARAGVTVVAVTVEGVKAVVVAPKVVAVTEGGGKLES
jgi:hypothetical protein